MDLIEDDSCNKPEGFTGLQLYERMQNAIVKSGRPMLLYVCSWGSASPWEWGGRVGQFWRTDQDISATRNRVRWEDILRNFDSNARRAVFSAPGSWNDADMLEVGNAGISVEEARSHFGMWAISASPLWAGTDLTNMDAEVHAILTNRALIAVNQDALGDQARKVREDAYGLEVWSKRLGSPVSGSRAIMLLNRTAAAARIAVAWSDLDLLPAASSVRELWTGADLGMLRQGYSAVVPSHGSVMLKVEGRFSMARGVNYEAEYPGNVRTGDTSLLRCPGCSSGYAVTLASKTASLEFPQLEVPAAGAYDLVLHYVSDGEHTNRASLEVRVNGGDPVTLRLNWATAGSATLTTQLKAGRNALVLSGAGPGLVNVDNIVVAGR